MNYHEKYNKFYNTPAWKIIREKKYGEAYGLCEECKKKGITKIGVEVHHIKSLEERWDLRLEESNLILLCKSCHDEKHERISLLEKFLKKWEEI